MRSALFVARVVVCCVLAMTGPAHAFYFKLAGPPSFDVANTIPADVGGITTVNDGEGGVTTQVIARSFTSAEFVSTQPRYGTQRIRFSWDAPPENIRTGDLLPVGVRWESSQTWNRGFYPQMRAMFHLDLSGDWYSRTIGPKPSGSEQNDSVKVAVGANWTEPLFYWNISCGGAQVRIAWRYKLVDGDPPATSPRAKGAEVILFKLESVAAVTGNPPRKTIVTLDRPVFVTKIWTYHWNNGNGATTGTIGLKNLDSGDMVGEWDAVGFTQKLDFSPGSVWQAVGDGPPNRYWAVKPGVYLPAGTYEVLDSDRTTWSTNSEMRNMGAAWVYGRYQ